MADKFEFKNKEKTSNLDIIKKKTSLVQYKQLIFQLSQAVNNLSKDNDLLSSQIQTIKQKNHNQNETLIMRQKQIQVMKENLKNQSQLLHNKQQMVENLRNKCIELENQIKMMEKKCQKLEMNVLNDTKKNDYAEQLNQANLLKIKMLETKLQQAETLNDKLTIQYDKKTEQSQIQIKSLRQFNQDLRRKFKNIQIENYANLHSNFQLNGKTQIQEYDFKQKKSFSTEKKTKRHIGFLSCNTQVLKKKPNLINQSIRPFSTRTNNPQLDFELESLKKQIAHQYTLINLKTQNYSKQRVNKTLEALKQKMSNVYLEVQESDSQSCLQY